jgi:hypothetical protein
MTVLLGLDTRNWSLLALIAGGQVATFRLIKREFVKKRTGNTSITLFGINQQGEIHEAKK